MCDSLVHLFYLPVVLTIVCILVLNQTYMQQESNGIKTSLPGVLDVTPLWRRPDQSQLSSFVPVACQCGQLARKPLEALAFLAERNKEFVIK